MKLFVVIFALSCSLAFADSVSETPPVGEPAGAILDFPRREVSDSFLRSLGISALIPAPAAVECCKVCTKGKACGDSCIAVNKECHKPPGCACNG